MATYEEEIFHASEKNDVVPDARDTNEQEGTEITTPWSSEVYVSSALKSTSAANDEKFVSPTESVSDTLAEFAGCEMDMSTPITYHYLTFETLLPSPRLSPSSTSALPPQPNLKKFQSPFDWSKTRKSLTIWMSCIATLVASYAAGSYSSGSHQMEAEWNVSAVAINVGITSFCFGFAIAPMVLAPFSEINGRYPVFVLSGFLFVVCQICCAVTQSYAGMIVARFFVGCGSSVFSSMVGGVVSDMYHTRERNNPMAIFSGGALFGTGLGPLVSGFIAQHTTWRWIFWVQVMTNGILMAAFALFYSETRGNIILSRKAKALNAWYAKCEEMGHFGLELAVPDSQSPARPQRIRWKVKTDEDRQSIGQMVQISVYRPFHLLFTEPVVFFFSLWVTFAWTVLYATFTSIPLVFSRSHGFSIEESGSVFSVLSIATTIATILSIRQEKLLSNALAERGEKKSTDPQGGTATQTSRLLRRLDLTSPEARLYFACVESVLLPVGLFMFGWTQFHSIHWIVPTIALGFATMGIFFVYLSTFNYLADTYHRYASSALAAQSFCRNIIGGIFPLFTVALFNNLTFQGAGSLLGGLGALLTLVPWVLVYAGPTIRARSKFASEIM
ncbi:hypothetical protein BP6252_07288 [Coleophoma cylindrospora]|uniref:Major facilitator superfamily (MFS) profile domain-containing protein n=1 Tax=Coleophoma cylindrospora TaxID=1849047 RepID=A0A3D8RHR1_9HELO|nr:hypothetical protein BP6252_07288 [Coleophoma cylindrospora]